MVITQSGSSRASPTFVGSKHETKE
uniref:Uncharacterized protein n=1 Tax=Arundo donax TaxID=35708 RepID=A0A0A9CKT4_ARUDO